ncbi:hypothetical protein M011DRAFT_469866 [Sporormia fimetaria CBS 119925]|uniref:G-patch domain-containing protein n=1 Tax=Sporormia fimetaria CBS 119925 TaxID=1340428 RepID=A0A6A6V5H5_9PLEO|nr:hypothetical protein M011DRAFT_469866 [Sporormia fimetaria CBS 119925]
MTQPSRFPEPDPNNTDDSDPDPDISTAPFNTITLPASFSNLRYRPVSFVPASTSDTPAPAAPKPLSIADQYLAIVFPNGVPKPSTTPAGPLCPTCNEAITEDSETLHYHSLGHQMALKRHTPSSIDRTRMGLKVMQKYGFDVDSGKGLGAAGEGIQYPIIVKEKRDNAGLGLEVRKQEDGKKGEKNVEEILHAGQVRKKVAEDKRKAQKLQRLFYGDEEREKYLEELEGLERGTRGGGFKMGGFKVVKRKRR